MTNRERVLSILQGVNRPGMDNVIKFITEGKYFTANCRGHHFIGKGGVAEHSLEVYDYLMDKFGDTFSGDTIAIVALFHDLGKSVCYKDGYGRGQHPERSVAVLDNCGLELTPEERYAIGHHHDHNPLSLLNPLRYALSKGDCDSTGRWKKSHPEEVATKETRRHTRRKAGDRI